VLDKLVRSTKAVTAARSLAYVRAAFNWAAKREKVAQNPFVGLPVATVTAERERVLTDAELADVWAAIETMGYPWDSTNERTIGPWGRFAQNRS
jgi:integrase